ncbi:hypothetical protein IB232_04125 [Pseudomonas sp. PDM15]|uniref:hypothetical protein n=1 Tax=Pseudomonas sp. PDM15 TaxID=2769303 RepID=UPI00178415CD|nr:hypothetical protein [Pseudomonas sp. PDM15]MBD9424500.1 hypothetical protein [Pseudomonas sp. PDM15]
MSNTNHDKTPVPESSQQSQRGSNGGSGKLETPNPATEAIDKLITPTSTKQKEKEAAEIRSKTGEGKF